MKVLMLGNGFDLYHNLLTGYDDFMTISEYLYKKHPSMICFNDNVSIYSDLKELAEENESIQEKLSFYEEAYSALFVNSTEYNSFLEKIHTNCWFKYFLDIKNGDGWVALESQIKKALRHIRQNEPMRVEKLIEAIKENNCLSEQSFQHQIHYLLDQEDSRNFLFKQFEQFVEMLKLYLKIFVDSVLPYISSKYLSCNEHFRNKDYIITFNYTDTYAELYDANANIIHIHGKLDKEIVLGVNSDEDDSADNDDVRYIKYKKYYQRITKHTFGGLKKLIRDAKGDSYRQKGLFVVGHSLDPSDGDIITVLFDLFECIIIYYYNDKALDQYVKNLKIIFGAKELSKMTFSQKIIFQELPPNECLEVTHNDEL